MPRNKESKISEISSSRRNIYKVLSFLSPFFLLIAIELVLRIANVGNNYKLFVSSKEDGREYYVMNDKIGTKYFTNFPYSQTQHRYFPKEKSKDHLRIFVLGSSTVVGFPYAPNIAFPSQLERMLQQSLPHKKVEVINTSITAVNSYTLLDFTRMITKYEPDCIFFYAGHNEYYGALGTGSNAGGGNSRWIKMLHIRFSSLRTYQVLTNLFSSKHEELDKQGKYSGQTLLQRVAADKSIAYESPSYFKAINHFEKNLSQVVTICMKHDIPVILSEVVSNIKDLSPFGSIEMQGQKNADESYSSGLVKYEAGEFSQAKEDFYKAKELDCIRFRAPGEINKTIRKIAADKEVPLVEMVWELEKYAENGIIGKELMTEHVHPNRYGHYLMAEAFYHEFLDMYDDKNITRLTREEFDECYVNSVFTPYDEAFSNLIINNLKSGWPFVKSQKTAAYLEIYKAQDFADSLALASILSRDKQLVRQHTIMAAYYLDKGDSLMAAKEYHACAQLLNFNNPFYKNSIQMLIEIDRKDLAVPIAREAALRFEDLSSILFMADIQKESASVDKSLNTLQKYLKLCQNEEQLYEGYIRIHKIYKELEDESNANKYLRLIMEIDPMYLKVKTSASANELSKGNSIKLQQAQDLLKSQHADEAISLLKEIDKEEDNFLVTAILGQVMLANGNKDAYVYLEKVFEKYKNDEKLYESLIIAHMRVGNTERANELYLLFETIFPDSPQLPEMKKLLNN